MGKFLLKISASIFIGLVVLIVAVFALPCAPARAATSPQCWGVFAGVSNYQYINDLNYSDDDARDLYNDFSPVWGSSHTKLLVDSQASKSAILNAISWMAANAAPEDTVIFSFSGHGDDSGTFCPYDTLRYSYTNDISINELSSALNAVKAQKIVVILDICFAGMFKASLSKSGRVLMLACQAYEESEETHELQNGVFTYFILQAIDKFDIADTNHDYELTAEEIAQYADPRTTYYFGEQHPVFYDGCSSQLALLVKFVFALNMSLPSGTTILTLDGINYTKTPGSLLWMPGSNHNITVPQSVDTGTGTKYEFTGWSDGSTSTTRAVAKGSLTADYIKEQLLKISSSLGNITGAGWYKDGAVADFSVTSYLETKDTRHYFVSWSGDYAGTRPSASVTMNSPKTITANWRSEYLLSVSSAYGNTAGTGWYDDGAPATVSVTSYIETTDTRHYFTGWSGDFTGTAASVSLVMNSPKYLTANWRNEYLLKINSEYGTPSGAGWYKEDEAAKVSVEPEQGFLVRHIFTGWSGDINETQSGAAVMMTSPKVIIAMWRTDYVQLYFLIGTILVLAAAITVTVIFIRRRG